MAEKPVFSKSREVRARAPPATAKLAGVSSNQQLPAGVSRTLIPDGLGG